MFTTEVSALENQRTKAIENIERNEALQRLYKNRDFIKLFMKYYMVEEAARYIQTAGCPSRTAEERADALAMAYATGHFKRFMLITEQIGSHDAAQLERLDAAIVASRAEEGDA